jgi:hypothetical protein
MKRLFASLCLLAGIAATTQAADLPQIAKVEFQPFASATERTLDALRYVGAPLGEADEQAVRGALRLIDQPSAIKKIQDVLDRYCVAGVHINPESRVKVQEGPVKKELVQQGWRTFLVKVHNEAGITPILKANSPNAAPQYRRSRNSPSPKLDITQADVAQRFLDIVMADGRPLNKGLSGLEVEYRIVQLYSRDVGRREATLAFNVGQGTQDIGFRNQVAILFNCVPAVEVSLGVKDIDGKPTSAAFVVRDSFSRVYPNPARRLAPDFFFTIRSIARTASRCTCRPGITPSPFHAGRNIAFKNAK